jgi:SAM-dependent methyltransferase
MSRIPHQWVLSDDVRHPSASVYANASALPFFEATLDLVTLPFTLDAHFDPEAVMDEVARVLVPEGKVIIAGINSRSPWGLAQQLGLPRWPKELPGFGFSRVQAALADLGLVMEYLQFGAHGFAEDTVSKPSVWAAASQRFWPQSGGVYFLVAKKRVMGVRPTRRLPWRLPKLAQLPLRPYPAPRPSHWRQDP